jgi:uncharacterized protein
MLSRRTFLGAAAAASALSSHLFAQSPLKTAASVPSTTSASARTKLHPFRYRDVKLAAGPLKEQFDASLAFFMKLDNDRMLKAYRQITGLPAPGDDMGGWYNVGAFAPGHGLGQWMSSLSRCADATGDAAVKDKVAALVHGLGEALAGPKSFYDGHRFKAYLYDKHVLGLTEAATLAGVSDAKDVLARVTAQADKVLPEKALTREEMRQRPHRDISYTWDESYTLPENLFIAHDAFGDARYLEMAKRFLHDKPYFEPLAAGTNALVGQHAYSHINALSSAARAHLVLGDDMHLAAARNGWKFMTVQSYASGGWGPNEAFVEPGKGKLAESLLGTHNHFETPCGAYAHFKLARYLMRITGESSYGDSLERMLYNGILAAKPPRPDGSAFYYSDYHPHAQKHFHPEKWPCCSGTYPQVIADYLVSMYFHDGGDGLFVNLYAPSALKWNDVTLTQTTDYPDSDRIFFRLRLPEPKSFAISFRIPAWAQNATFKVNGEDQHAAAGTFAKVTRTWRDGDTVELTLPMTHRTEAIDEQHEHLVALMRGPVLMVAVDQHVKIPRAAIPDDPTKSVAAGEVKFVPFHRVRDETYTTYFTQT